MKVYEEKKNENETEVPARGIKRREKKLAIKNS
eukprot:CAMPEP_0176344006 /NCGR_PEP_ID=MMETSP0126-20121128/4368_1 /TAXON_ID=141414 ORGANISM="Strombidinopsis acuminatum, Strain SPMC142" /NCGR_SAMPLE_ID=MMETSP0126 /ASSEMBLY_ACC=CAM_ASM_000229 /LENGTH=32 /DNA_ID= /DNA_START= /DNA_END= /DNA_ORIENTATION=